MPVNYAAMDIGSNTVHLLVAEYDNGKLKRLANESEWLSLGEVVSREGTIPKKDAIRLLQRIADFKAIADSHRVAKIYCFATEAMRQSDNHAAILKDILKQTGLKVSIISPAEEVELSAKAMKLAPKGEEPFTLVEMGGGSIQIATCQNSRILRTISLPLGTGVLIAQSQITQPSSESQETAIDHHVTGFMESLAPYASDRRVVAVGGVARGIWRALHPDGEKTLAIEELSHLAWDCKRLPLDRIVSRYGVKQKRAQTLFPGAFTFAKILKALHKQELQIFEYGVREGAILALATEGQ